MNMEEKYQLIIFINEKKDSNQNITLYDHIFMFFNNSELFIRKPYF
jgi:hypothetical protein